MRAEVFAPAEFSADLQTEWRTTQKSCPPLAGPCFHPSLFLAVAEHVPGIKIAVLTRNSGERAFWPFLQIGGERIARPVPACDYGGIVAAVEQWDVREILRELNLTTWEFENLISISGARPPDNFVCARSPRIVLEGGVDTYLAGQRNAGKTGRNLKTHRRLLQRNHGPVRFVSQSGERPVLDALTRWKADRFKGFADWARRTIETIHSRPEEEFGGVLSALFAGDALVAAHFGLRCDGILHYWFPGFNPEFGRYSASRLLLEDLIAQLPSLQCHTLDLGPGGESYKDYFANELSGPGGGAIQIGPAPEIEVYTDEELKQLSSLLSKSDRSRQN